MSDKSLVLFSGGKDSFLAAAMEAAAGRHTVLISFDGGSMMDISYLRAGAERMSKQLKNISYAGCYQTVGIISNLKEYWVNSSMADMGKDYPHMTNCQFQCLHCQTAMWVAAIAYAAAKGIGRIACGYKATDEFCTGQPWYLEEITALAKPYSIEIATPVHKAATNYERDMRIGDFGFIPKVLEPRCCIGSPALDGCSEALFADMRQYYKEQLSDKSKQEIGQLIPVFRSILLPDRFDKP